MIISKIIGLEVFYVLLLSVIFMVGGYGVVFVYGDIFVKMGYESVSLVGVVVVIFGFIFVVLIGGFFGRRLIEKNNLKFDNIENFD